VLVAAVATVVRLVTSVASPDQITQTYDTVFHDNVVAHIVQTGEASSLHALPPIRDVYPIAFQQFAALGDMAFPALTAPAAVTCAWLVFGAVVWPVSILFLVRTVCGRHALSDFVAPLLAVSVAGGPFLLLDWGTLYSMFAGQTLLPVLFALTWRWCMRDWRRGASVCVSGLAWIAVAGLAVSFAHFRVIMTFLLTAMPLALFWLWSVAVRLRETRGVRAMRIAVGAFAAVVLAVFAAGCAVFARMYVFDTSRPISDHLNGGPALPTEDIPSAIGRFLTGTPINAVNQRLATDWLVVALLVVALVGIVTCGHAARDAHDVRSARAARDGDADPAERPDSAGRATRRDGLLLVAGFVLLGFVFVACAGTHTDWAKVVSALWYKDQRRLFAAWPMMAAPIICLGVRALCGRLASSARAASIGLHDSSDRSDSSDGAAPSVPSAPFRPSDVATAHRPAGIAPHALRTVIAVLAVLVCVASPQMTGMMHAVKGTYAFAENGKDYPMLTSDEYLLLKRIGTHVPEDEMVVSDPWNGSALMLAVGRRTPFYAHLYMAWDYDHAYLGGNLKNLGTDPQVCEIIRRNDLHWYVSMGGPYAPDDPNQNVFDGLAVVPDAMQAVDRQGDAVLYRITGCGV
ncbi:DUF6541 family protein, partial [Bifidobacterium saguinibicoloris]|uniref:DUF6541 family protein n=1 Tax=Bifidobacterium saguinibicoloris TaxID=2834433 RepID=UPI001C59D91A